MKGHRKQSSQSGIVPPTLITPEFEGQTYRDTVGNKTYIARSLTEGDWEEINAQGVKGDKGEQGIQGETGLQGEQGLPGNNGLDGVNGINGIDGKDGIDGINGANGNDGQQGIQGEQGLKGDKGDTGNQGISGTPGTNASIHTKVGYFTSPSSIGNYSVSGLGFKPKAIHFVGHKNDGMQTWFMQSNGFVDEFLNQNVSSFCGNYSNTFRGDAKQDRCIYLFNASGAIQVMATLVSMNEDGFTLNFTNINTLFGIRWMSIG